MPSPFVCEFPDLEPGFLDIDSDTWYKPFSRNEWAVYQEITPHPRILALQGLSLYEDHLVLQHQPKGDLWTYLLEKEPCLDTRVTWALDMVEGIAHLHSKSVVWADAHLRNILVTDDLHIVLADFAFSIINPEPLHWFTTAPPPIFKCPIGYYGKPPLHVDIFGCGIILFVLLTNRFPWTANLMPSADEQVLGMQNHDEKHFDTVDDPELKRYFGLIVEKCFKAEYLSGTHLLDDMKIACANWAQDTNSDPLMTTTESL